jgi:hypothetical protein
MGGRSTVMFLRGERRRLSLVAEIERRSRVAAIMVAGAGGVKSFQ